LALKVNIVLMWQEVGRQIFGAPTRCCGTFMNCHDLQWVSQNNRIDHKLDRSNSLPQFKDKSRVYEWYRTLNCAEKDVLEHMMSTFTSHGVKIKTVVKLIAQKFNISQRFVRDVVAWWSKGWSGPSPVLMKMKSKVRGNLALKLAKWEKMAIESKHNYSKETLKGLLDAEAKQETS